MSAEAREEWRSHWKLVLASAIGASMMAIALSSLGAFIAPLQQAFGWGRAEISAALWVYSVSGVVLAPLFGSMLDRWGPRRFGVPGVLLAGVAFALFGTATGSIVQWFGLWILYSVVAQITRPLMWSQAVSSEFKASRGVALGIIWAGSGCGGLVAPILAGHLISDFGWRLAYAIMGLGWGSLACVACYLFFYGRSDRLRMAPGGGERAVAVLTGVSARAGLTSATFVKIAVATLLANSLIVGLLVHMIPLLSGTGLARGDATWVAGLAGIAGVTGQLICGALADRLPGNRLLAFFLALLAVPCCMLLLPSSSVALRVVPVVLFGMSGGAEPHMLSYLISRHFGMRAFGKLFGALSSVIAISVGLGPVVAGYIFDRTHSYRLFLLGGMPVAVVAALLILSLRAYPDDPGKLPDSAPAVP
jgi:MFS family permease